MKTEQKTIALGANEWDAYELLDTGLGQKLERFGAYTLIRPEPQAMWPRAGVAPQWENAAGVFQSSSEEGSGRWEFAQRLPRHWEMRYRDVAFFVSPTPFRHVGVFPEHAPHWAWMADGIARSGRPIRVLNLFGYTGIASLVCAAAGAEVTHVDASKKIIAAARENQELSHLRDKPIRWIEDDALKFSRRAARRGERYDGVIIDPPKFGRGSRGEVWKLHDLLPGLLLVCRALLSKDPLFAILTCYAVHVSPSALGYMLEEVFAGYGGELARGELALTERSRGRIIPQAAYARWLAAHPVKNSMT